MAQYHPVANPFYLLQSEFYKQQRRVSLSLNLIEARMRARIAALPKLPEQRQFQTEVKTGQGVTVYYEEDQPFVLSSEAARYRCREQD